MKLIIKLERGVLHGRTLPDHIGRAYGRYIFRLMHTDQKPRVSIWLRDLPLNLSDLDYDYHLDAPLRAYVAECDRVGVPRSARVVDLIPVGHPERASVCAQ